MVYAQHYVVVQPRITDTFRGCINYLVSQLILCIPDQSSEWQGLWRLLGCRSVPMSFFLYLILHTHIYLRWCRYAFCGYILSLTSIKINLFTLILLKSNKQCQIATPLLRNKICCFSKGYMPWKMSSRSNS